MTWSDPTTRQTGDLITAAIWNQDVVDNTVALRDRLVTLWWSPDTGSGVGDWPNEFLDTGQSARISFVIPDDTDTLISVEAVIWSDGNCTWQCNLNSDYFNPDNGETYSHHSESVTGVQVSAVEDEPFFLDLLDVLSSAAAGDCVGIAISCTGNANDSRLLGVRIVYQTTL